jgi:hypothetical protein
MKSTYILTVHKYIVIYKKVFPLRKGLTFPRYMQIVNELDFSPYVFEIKKMALFEYYFLELLFNPLLLPLPVFRFPSINKFSALILLNKCTIRYSKREREISLEAGTNIGNLLLYGSYIALAIITLYGTIITFSYILLIMTILISIYLVSIYNRDIQKYEKMISMASKPPKRTKGKK